MSLVKRLGRALAAALILAVAPLAGAARAETLIGLDIDSRFMLGFAVAPDGLAELMPVGWTAVALPSGPLAGANLLLGLEDRQLAMTPEGAPATPPKSRAAAFLALGKGEAGVRLFVLRVLTTDAGYDTFPDGVTAQVARTSRLEGARQFEEWRVAPATGGTLSVTFDFAPGIGNWLGDEARPWSAAQPDLSRIFRYDQLVDLVASRAAGRTLDGTLSLSTDIPALAVILDGTQDLVGLLAIPVYIREVYAP